MATKIQLRRDTEANWTSNNPVLASGEIGIDTEQGLFKIGNGADDWESLNYATTPMGTSEFSAISIGKDSSGSSASISIGMGATSSSNGISVGNGSNSNSGVSIGSSTITAGGVSIGNNAKSESYSMSAGRSSESKVNSVSVGTEARSDNNSISLGFRTTSQGNGINLGGYLLATPDNYIQIGTSDHTILKIPAVAGSTNGMTLKVNTDGTIYAE